MLPGRWPPDPLTFPWARLTGTPRDDRATSPGTMDPAAESHSRLCPHSLCLLKPQLESPIIKGGGKVVKGFLILVLLNADDGVLVERNSYPSYRLCKLVRCFPEGFLAICSEKV